MSLFNFFKKNKEKNYIEIYSPLNGKVIDLSEVPDKMFADKMIGDGCAIDPTEGFIHSVADAKINIFDTNHLITFDLRCGLELIVHFGIDTIKLDGHGFERLVMPGDIKAGDKIIKYNLEYILKNSKSAITPIIIPNMEDISELEVVATGDVKVGDLLMKVVLKQ